MPSLSPLVLAALYWRRVTRAGAIASVLVAAVAWAVLFWQGLVLPMAETGAADEDYLILGMMPVTILFTVSALTLVVVSLLTRPPPAAVVDRFFPDSR